MKLVLPSSYITHFVCVRMCVNVCVFVRARVWYAVYVCLCVCCTCTCTLYNVVNIFVYRLNFMTSFLQSYRRPLNPTDPNSGSVMIECGLPTIVGGVIGGGAKLPATIGPSIESETKEKSNKKGECWNLCISLYHIGCWVLQWLIEWGWLTLN